MFIAKKGQFKIVNCLNQWDVERPYTLPLSHLELDSLGLGSHVYVHFAILNWPYLTINITVDHLWIMTIQMYTGSSISFRPLWNWPVASLKRVIPFFKPLGNLYVSGLSKEVYNFFVGQLAWKWQVIKIQNGKIKNVLLWFM